MTRGGLVHKQVYLVVFNNMLLPLVSIIATAIMLLCTATSPSRACLVPPQPGPEVGHLLHYNTHGPSHILTFMDAPEIHPLTLHPQYLLLGRASRACMVDSAASCVSLPVAGRVGLARPRLPPPLLLPPSAAALPPKPGALITRQTSIPDPYSYLVNGKRHINGADHVKSVPGYNFSGELCTLPP